MSVTTPTKTDSVTVISHQAAVHPVTIVGSAIDCSTKRRATIYLYQGYNEATTDTNPGKFIVQVRPDPGGGTVNEHWITVVELSARGTNPDTSTLTATCTAPSSTLTLGSGTGFAAEDEIYIADNTLADGEWAKVKSVSGTTVILVDGVTNTHASGATQKVCNDCSKWVVDLDVSDCTSFRVIWMHQGATGADSVIKALAVTYDSDTTT